MNSSAFTVLMSTADQRTWYPLHFTRNSVTVTCVSSYTIFSGPNNPFEHVKIVLTKQEMSRMAPNLKVIEPGKNLLSISAVGSGQFIITSCKYSDKKYTITAYTDADKIRRYTYPETKTQTAEAHVKYALGGDFGVRFQGDGGLVWRIRSDAGDGGEITIPKGASVWTTLQMCAMSLGARVFFSGGKAYIVDWSEPSEDDVVFDIDDAKYTLIGSVVQGNVGSNSVANYLSADCKDDAKVIVGGMQIASDGETSYPPAVRSEHYYSRRDGGTYDLRVLTAEQGTAWLMKCLDYTVEAQVDVTFKLNENTDSGGELVWEPVFGPYACIRSVLSSVDEVSVSAVSTIGVSTGKIRETRTETINGVATDVIVEVDDGINSKMLMLTSVERSYPEGFSEYTFGQVKNISLANSTSEIYSSLGTRMTNLTK